MAWRPELFAATAPQPITPEFMNKTMPLLPKIFPAGQAGLEPMFPNPWKDWKRRTLLLLGAFFALVISIARADQLDAIRQAGVLRVAVFDSNPPFGFVGQSGDLKGYDIDFAKAIAGKLGVKLQLVPTNPANRIPLLQSGRVDLIVADLTITPERAQVFDFSTPYFVMGQQLLVPSGSPDKLDTYATARIGVVKGTTGQQRLIEKFPKARILAYDDVPQAFTALRNANVQAISQDSTILDGLLAGAPDKAKYKIVPEFLSREEVGIGVAKGQKALLDQVNQILVGLEADGQAVKIYNEWFGPETKFAQPRDFQIVAPK